MLFQTLQQKLIVLWLVLFTMSFFIMALTGFAVVAYNCWAFISQQPPITDTARVLAREYPVVTFAMGFSTAMFVAMMVMLSGVLFGHLMWEK